MQTQPATEQRWHVAVLDGGLTGAALAAILARRGLRVLMLGERPSAQRAGGELVIPYTAMLLRTLGKRYDVPELAGLAAVTPTTGAGRSLGFFYYGPHGTQHPDQVHQIAAPRRMPPEPALFRPDADAAVRATALRYGAIAPEAGDVVEVDTGPGGVQIRTVRAETFHADYVVDCAGQDGALGRQPTLIGRPRRLPAQLHSISTHMAGAGRLAPLAGQARQAPCSWDEGTVYHIFDGGYLWCTPFDNHPDAVHRLTSVGVCLDARRHRPDPDPEAQFSELLAQLPLAARQLATARPTEPFRSTTLQDFAENRAGERWCLLPESSATVDGLFSWSLSSGLELVNALAHRLITAARTGDYAGSGLPQMDRIARNQISAGVLAHRMFLDATTDSHLLTAALKVLSLGTMLGTFQLGDYLARIDSTAPDALHAAHETASWPAPYFAGHAGYRDLVMLAAEECAAAGAGRIPAEAASANIFAAIAESGFAPLPFGFADPGARFYHPAPEDIGAVLEWAETAPDRKVGALVRSTLLAAVSGSHALRPTHG
ncbi:NAD(P)/FAD-dependent oxidoreductase [Streptomyces purpurogeneiscleroticus]|uniref:NAD(P)/FAD-dependent oxidoreductase n=1 Tax=Streptomyces purpurogeneiscleroticus TaxID=68259 RepID=UPI001CC13688|nr:hypothetical protein [Streptomyces purpurogeneiscleroticus]MBZ4016044.1 hypothetical protein [Streptomyces purpurogeneiscleroticus]